MKPLALLIFSCLQQYVVAQGFVEPFRIDDAERANDIRHTRDEILKHSPSTLNPWEGKYSGDFGTDTYTSIFVSVKHGIATNEHGVSGVHAGNCGVIEVKNSEIFVSFKYAEDQSTGFPTQLLIVPWGDAYFLVPKGRIHGFCLDAKKGKPFLLSKAYCLERTRPKKLEGLPSIPEKYKACLSADAIKTHIINAKKAMIEKLPSGLLKITQTVSLDCGEQAGVYVGMEFESSHPYAVLTVTNLDKTECTCAFESIEHPLSEIAEGLAIGMLFGTVRY